MTDRRRRPTTTPRPTTRSGPRPPAQGGFTLVGVMVALAVTAIALGTGLKAAGALTANTERLVQVTAAQWCADNQLTEMRLTRQFPGVGDIEFGCDQLGRSYQGVLVVRATPNPNFRRVDARISDDAGQPLLTLSTVVPRY